MHVCVCVSASITYIHTYIHYIPTRACVCVCYVVISPNAHFAPLTLRYVACCHMELDTNCCLHLATPAHTHREDTANVTRAYSPFPLFPLAVFHCSWIAISPTLCPARSFALAISLFVSFSVSVSFSFSLFAFCKCCALIMLLPLLHKHNNKG